MPTLTVATTKNFSAIVLANIDKIDFTGFIVSTTATFTGAQFNNVQILKAVAIDGSTGGNSIIVNNNGVDASGWTFTNWLPSNSITFNGSSNAQICKGTTQREAINANGGDDTIGGSAGADWLRGGDGDDMVTYAESAAAVRVNLLAGTASGGDAAGDALISIEKLVGSGQADTLTGSDIDNFLAGGGGNDTLSGQGGNDTLLGTEGADAMDGGLGDDLFTFLGVNNIVLGETIDGGAGTGDKITISLFTPLDLASISNVEILQFVGGSSRMSFDQIGTATGIRDVIGSSSSEVLQITGAGDIDLSGVTFTNWLSDSAIGIIAGTTAVQKWTGSSVSDSMLLSGGADTLAGGGGDDVFRVQLPADLGPGLNLSGGDGVDRIEIIGDGLFDFTSVKLSGIERVDIAGPAAGLVLRDTQIAGGLTQIDGTGSAGDTMTITGGSISLAGFALTSWANGALITLTGSTGNDVLTSGGVGRVKMNGGSGNDTLTSAGGADTLNGGIGNDTYISNGGAFITESVDAGTDTVQSSTAFSLESAGNVERLFLTGSGNFNATGNALGNHINGNAGSNILRGLAGNDSLNGGEGADTIEGGPGNDTMNGGGGVDIFRLTTTNAGADTINGFLVGADKFDLQGGSFSTKSESGGDTTLTYTGGSVLVAGITGLSIAQWNDLQRASFVHEQSINHEFSHLPADYFSA